MYLITLLASAAASFTSGLVGAGGGVILAPMLLYGPPLFGAQAMSVKLVTGLTIVQALSGSVIGTARHRHHGNVSVRLVRLMGPVAGLAAFIGALLSSPVNDSVLLGIFAVFAIASSMFLVMPARQIAEDLADDDVDIPVALGVAGIIGFFAGMAGVGAIGFIVAALIYVMRVSPRVAIGSSLGIGIFPSAAGFVGKAATAQIDISLALVVVVAALAASPLGAAVSVRTQPAILVRLLAIVLFVVGVRMALQAIIGI